MCREHLAGQEGLSLRLAGVNAHGVCSPALAFPGHLVSTPYSPTRNCTNVQLLKTFVVRNQGSPPVRNSNAQSAPSLNHRLH